MSWNMFAPSEGYIPRVGQCTKLAENYPAKLAAKLAEALVNWCTEFTELGGWPQPVTVSEPAQKNGELQRQVVSGPFI